MVSLKKENSLREFTPLHLIDEEDTICKSGIRAVSETAVRTVNEVCLPAAGNVVKNAEQQTPDYEKEAETYAIALLFAIGAIFAFATALCFCLRELFPTARTLWGILMDVMSVGMFLFIATGTMAYLHITPPGK